MKKESEIWGRTDWTALMYAAQRGHKEAVEILLEHEKGIRSSERNTAFVHSVREGHLEIAEITKFHGDFDRVFTSVLKRNRCGIDYPYYPRSVKS